MIKNIELREVFHFHFLERLIKISDVNLYILKGGVNLRYFFNSPRYSEDMDIDAIGGNVQTLTKNAYKILNDPSLVRSLKTFGIEKLDLNDPTKAKQTSTTQRFRLGLITSSGLRLPTKIEFSRREVKHDSKLELVNPEIARKYSKLSFACKHYTGKAATKQKITALINRSETQARDVFDLGILFTAGFLSSSEIAASFSKTELKKAQVNLLSLDFSDFRGQVLEFLDDEDNNYKKQDWETLQERVWRILSDES